MSLRQKYKNRQDRRPFNVSPDIIGPNLPQQKCGLRADSMKRALRTYKRSDGGSCITDRCYDFQNIFAKKIGKKYWRFLLKLLIPSAKKFDLTMVFEKNANFSPKIGENRRMRIFGENWRKSQKTVIIQMAHEQEPILRLLNLQLRTTSALK
jgi:hypothetical protein